MKVIQACLQQIQNDRFDIPIDKTLLKGAFQVIVSLNRSDSGRSKLIYKEFERQVLLESKAYFNKKFQLWSRSLSSAEYHANVERLLDLEEQRLELCMPEQDGQETCAMLLKEFN